MKVGLFFGSFNPVHTGHLIIASHMAQCTDLQQVWFVVSPLNPLKKKDTLLNQYDRLHLVRLAIEDNPLLCASEIEFGLPRPNYTIDTLTVLREKHPEHDFTLIMGSDNIESLPKWKNYEAILKYYKIYAYKRGEIGDNDLYSHPSVKIFDFPLLDISASYIRNFIQQGHSIHYLVPDKVAKYIHDMNLYKR
jgi:nicotinate-nucleotide adenylyltransferase